MIQRAIAIALIWCSVLLASGLEDIFNNPPNDAKPRGYWLWPHGNFDYGSIKKELREFKEKGLGGVDIFDLGVRDPKNIIPAGPAFLSPEQVDGIAFVLEEAKKLDLKIGLIVSSSWNAGGSWTTPEHAAMNLVASIDTVEGPIRYNKLLPFPTLPDSFSKPYGKFPLNVPKNENGLPKYFKDIATLVFPISENRLLENPELFQKFDSPHVDVDLPKGRWIIMRTVCTNFGQMLWVPSKNSTGLAIDHFSKEAVSHHFKTVIEKLERRCGPLKNTALERLYLASYESNASIIWTPEFSQEFYKRNNYNIKSYIPALFGITIESQEITDRFLYDFRKTVSEVFIDNLYRNARKVCQNHGLELCCEAGGPGAPLHDVPTEDLKALGALDVMRGEFWVDKSHRFNPDGFEQLQIVKSIASAAHIYGHKIVEMESFTSHTNWQEGPATLKPFADRAFCEGMNRVVYHTMSHNVPEAGVPGWTYGAGTHINTNLTWWEQSKQLNFYLAKCSAMLQQGVFVADVCYYYGHQIPNFAKPKHIRPDLGPGYDYDDINTEILLQATVKDGQITLPGGISYHILVLPDEIQMDLNVLKKIKTLLQNGATVIGPKPKLVYGLANYKEQQNELQKIADDLWGENSLSNLDVTIGKGRLVFGKSSREILKDKGVFPDVEFLDLSTSSLDYIHRQTENADMYFIRNSLPEPVFIDAIFRISDKQPEFWNPETGEIAECAIYTREKNKIRLPIHLYPHGSVFVVFREKIEKPFVSELKKDGKQIFPQKSKSQTTPFTLSRKQDNLFLEVKNKGTFELILNDRQQLSIFVEEAPEIFLTGSYDVRFPHGWGVPAIQTFNSLYSWTESDNEETRAFSGMATYHKKFDIPGDYLGQNQKLMLDLGKVKEIATVFLNGHELGTTVFAPHVFDITKIVRPGENFLVVKVTNTWLNRLIYDDNLPDDERLTNTNLTRGPTGETLWRDAKPKSSGLLGPVRIIPWHSQVITLK